MRRASGTLDPRWAVLAASFVTLVLVYGATYSYPVFLVALARDLGGQRGGVAGAFALHNLVVGVAATVVGHLMARFGERPVLGLGALVLGAGLALAGTAGSPLGLLVWFGVVAGLGAGALGSVAQTVMLSRWFPRARGTVNGIALSGMGIGIFLFAPLSAWLIRELGWRLAFATLGIGTGLLLLPTNAWLPASAPEGSTSRAARSERHEEPHLATVLGTFRFWCFATAFFFTPVSNMMVTAHQFAHVVDAGVDPGVAAAAFGMIGLLSGVGRVAFGALSDRWGRVPTALASYALTVVGTVALALVAPTRPGWVLWVFVLAFGITFGARGPVVAALAADVYRGPLYGTVLGLISFGNRVGSAVGPWLGGAIHDRTGSYAIAFSMAVGALVLAAVGLVGAGRGVERAREAGRPLP